MRNGKGWSIGSSERNEKGQFLSSAALSCVCHPERKHCARGLCRPCYMAVRASDNKTKDAEYQSAWYVAHKATLAPHRAAYRASHKREGHANYIAHRAERSAYHARRRADPTHRAAILANTTARRANDINFHLACNLRERLCKAIRNGQKAGSAVRDLGCTIDHLRLHLELFWDEGMGWNNWGNRAGQWSIDHVTPVAAFDLTDQAEFLKANHFMNLQPLWHMDNLRKGARSGVTQ